MWGYHSNQRNPMLMLFGMILLFGLFMMMARGGGWPFFIFFFWVGPWLFRTFRREIRWGWDEEEAKRKNDDYEKAKNEDWVAAPAEYITTDDGEVMEVIDDRPARRHNDLI